jgi:hypothetical protein
MGWVLSIAGAALILLDMWDSEDFGKYIKMGVCFLTWDRLVADNRLLVAVLLPLGSLVCCRYLRHLGLAPPQRSC